jgi:isocitrate dehydrogenase kinase/phosphatase
LEKERTDYTFELENLRKQVHSLEEHKSLIYTELRRQADGYETTKEDFILKLKENYTDLLKLIEEMKKQMGQ